MNEAGSDTWVVVIEATAGPRARAYDFERIGQLVRRLGGWHATGLYCSDRYAVQVHVDAPSCSDGLRLALSEHRRATDDLAMTPLVFLRAEVLTPEVLAHDWQAEGSEVPAGPSTMVPTRVYEATRALLHATDAAEIRCVVVDFVVSNGGSVAMGGPRPASAELICTDMGLWPDETTYASAEALSVGGMLIERFLPGLIDDARRAIQRLERQPDPR